MNEKIQIIENLKLCNIDNQKLYEFYNLHIKKFVINCQNYMNLLLNIIFIFILYDLSMYLYYLNNKKYKEDIINSLKNDNNDDINRLSYFNILLIIITIIIISYYFVYVLLQINHVSYESNHIALIFLMMFIFSLCLFIYTKKTYTGINFNSLISMILYLIFIIFTLFNYDLKIKFDKYY